MVKFNEMSKYRAFISYAHADVKWARWIQRKLETYRIPEAIVRESGMVTNTLRPIFRDSDELGSTPDLSEAIQGALIESETLIVVCSAAARESTWVNREVEYFLELSPERARRVYCLLVGGDTNDDIAEILPPALADYEGLAADLRRGGDGPQRARLKLVAALVGVNLDRLIQRDRTQRRRRAALAGTAAAAIGSLVAFLALQSHQLSLEAQEKALVADELVTYMLDDLKKRLDEFDGVARLDPGFNNALAYFESLAPGDMSIATLERYFDALTSAGDLRLREGKTADALRIWERSSEISGRLIERNPNVASSWRRHGDSFVSLALAHWEEPGKVVLNLKKALEFFEKAAELDPDDFANHGIQVATLNNLGAGYTKLREFGIARSTFLRSLEMNADLLSRQWPDPAWVTNRMLRQEAESASWMTEVELHLGRPESAVDWHEREITIRREEISGGDDPVRLGDGLIWGARAYGSIGDDVTARTKRMEAEQLFEGLVQRDPDNFYWQRRYIESTLDRAMADIHLGDETQARQALAEIEQRLDSLSSEHADNIIFARMVATMEIVYAELSADSSGARSREFADQAMSRLEPLVQEDGTDFATVLLHAEAAALAAYNRIAAGMESQGRALARREVELIEQTSGESDFLRDKPIEVILLWLAGDRARGDAISAEMRASGYQSSQLDRWRERLQH